jgi:hypothetical protein
MAVVDKKLAKRFWQKRLMEEKLCGRIPRKVSRDPSQESIPSYWLASQSLAASRCEVEAQSSQHHQPVRFKDNLAISLFHSHHLQPFAFVELLFLF